MKVVIGVGVGEIGRRNGVKAPLARVGFVGFGVGGVCVGMSDEMGGVGAGLWSRCWSWKSIL